MTLRTAMALTIAAAPCASATVPQQSRQVEAAIIYGIVQFVGFPNEDRKSSVELCVLRDDPMAPYLRALDGHPVGARNLSVRSVTIEGYRDCDIAYIGTGSAAVARPLARAGIMTIGEGEDFLSRGGMIALVQSGRQVRFKIAYGVAAGARIKVSSKLLRLAMEVVR